MPPLPEAIILVLAPFAPLFSHRVWPHAQLLLLGAILTPGPRTVTAALRATGLATERRFTNYHRVLNRATWSARQGSRMLLSMLVTLLVPPEATIVLGADDTVERRSGRKISAKGCYRDAVRSSKSHVIRCFGLKWVSMMLLVAVPWSRRVWALPFLTALCWPADKRGPRRHKTSIDWVRQMSKQVRRWLPERRLVLVVDGGFAAVSLALACVKSRVAMVSRLRWDAALYHPPEPQPPGKRGRKPAKGRRQRSLQAWASRSDTPWEDVEVAWYGGQRKKLWVFSHSALWYTPGLPPVDIRYVLVADPEGKLRMEVFFCTDLEATPAQILEWAVMRWSVEVTFEEARAHLGLETQRQWSDHAGPAGPVFDRDRAGSATERCGSNPGADDRLVSQSRADLCGLFGLGASAFLACPVFRELHCGARLRAISSGGFRTLAHWPLVSGLVGQSRVERILQKFTDKARIFSLGFLRR